MVNTFRARLLNSLLNATLLGRFVQRRLAERQERHSVARILDYSIIRQPLDDEKEESIAFYLRVWPTSDPEDYAANFEPYVQNARSVMLAASDPCWEKEIKEVDSVKILTAFTRRLWAAPRGLALAAREDAIKKQIQDRKKEVRASMSEISALKRGLAFLQT
ncbi:hypothetical protein FIBSPDRAFT_163847 [Athelia psychrophila]|uniref:Uncharacterized protein n=1 Tax=Athelia psychrophila TaxID=1759441 RepID=A0A166SYY6_9AGAM|nr:hypothetical protein FIBSPDRAFT_163847 [Fibularhizoctonia sp. CBS 109695]